MSKKRAGKGGPRYVEGHSMTDPREMSDAELLAALGLESIEWVGPETGETLGTIETFAPGIERKEAEEMLRFLRSDPPEVDLV